VIELNDVLDGKLITGMDAGLESLNGNQVGFLAFFNDGSRGVYVAAIPEPNTVTLLIFGMLAIALRNRRR
jgi:hypothetical protein